MADDDRPVRLLRELAAAGHAEAQAPHRSAAIDLVEDHLERALALGARAEVAAAVAHLRAEAERELGYLRANSDPAQHAVYAYAAAALLRAALCLRERAKGT